MCASHSFDVCDSCCIIHLQIWRFWLCTWQNAFTANVPLLLPPRPVGRSCAWTALCWSTDFLITYPYISLLIPVGTHLFPWTHLGPEEVLPFHSTSFGCKLLAPGQWAGTGTHRSDPANWNKPILLHYGHREVGILYINWYHLAPGCKSSLEGELLPSLVSRPHPAYCHLQYGEAGEGLE